MDHIRVNVSAPFELSVSDSHVQIRSHSQLLPYFPLKLVRGFGLSGTPSLVSWLFQALLTQRVQVTGGSLPLWGSVAAAGAVEALSLGKVFPLSFIQLWWPTFETCSHMSAQKYSLLFVLKHMTSCGIDGLNPSSGLILFVVFVGR